MPQIHGFPVRFFVPLVKFGLEIIPSYCTTKKVTAKEDMKREMQILVPGETNEKNTPQ